MLLRVGQHAVGELLGLDGRERGQVERPELAVDADLGRRVGGDVEVGPPHLGHRLEQLVKADGHALPPCHDTRTNGATCAPPRDAGYRTVSRRTSSTVVTPPLIFSRPLMRSVSMPSSSAFLLISTAVAPTMIRSRMPSVISMT